MPDVGISPKELQTAGWDKHGVWWQPDDTIPGLWWYWSEETSWGRWKDQCAALKWSWQFLIWKKSGCPKSCFYHSFKNFSGTLIGAGFFPSTVCILFLLLFTCILRMKVDTSSPGAGWTKRQLWCICIATRTPQTWRSIFNDWASTIVYNSLTQGLKRNTRAKAQRLTSDGSDWPWRSLGGKKKG